MLFTQNSDSHRFSSHRFSTSTQNRLKFEITHLPQAAFFQKYTFPFRIKGGRGVRKLWSTSKLTHRFYIGSVNRFGCSKSEELSIFLPFFTKICFVFTHVFGFIVKIY